MIFETDLADRIWVKSIKNVRAEIEMLIARNESRGLTRPRPPSSDVYGGLTLLRRGLSQTSSSRAALISSSVAT